jgi:predicted dehydrogenase
VGTRIGFLGAGFITEIHRGMLAAAEADHVIAAVYDPDAEKAARFADVSGAHRMGSEAEVLDASDAVFICAWTSEHPRLVRAAAERGLAVFSEKPLAFDLAQAREMTDRVEAAGVVNQVGLILRSLPSFRLLRHLLDHPDNGRVMTAVFRDDQYIPVQGQYASTWRGDRLRAGAGTLLEHSIHDLDILEWLLGPVASVSARSRGFHDLDGIEDLAVVTLVFESGAIGSLTSVWHDVLARPSLRRLEIFCERAWFALEGEMSGPLRWQRSNGDEGVLQGRELAEAADDVGAGWDNPADRFLHAVGEGTATWPDFRSALRAHALTDAAYESARFDGTVRKPDRVVT